jgi:hypothetical protein
LRAAGVGSLEHLPQDGNILRYRRPWRLADDDGSLRRLDHPNQGLEVDRSAPEIGMTVTPAAGRIARAVRMNEIDPSGCGPHSLDDIAEVLARRVSMTRVEAEADVEVGEPLPQPCQDVDAPPHGVLAARGVLDEDGDRALEFLEDLPPPPEPAFDAVLGMTCVHYHRGGADLSGPLDGVGKDLARRDANPVVRRCDVYQIRRMDVHRDLDGLQRGCVGTRGRLLPRLRRADEELDGFGADRSGFAERVLIGDVGADDHETDAIRKRGAGLAQTAPLTHTSCNEAIGRGGRETPPHG